MFIIINPPAKKAVDIVEVDRQKAPRFMSGT